MSSERTHILFVCTMNQWRSPTAEQLWRRSDILATRSGGTSPKARHTVSVPDLIWADIVLVMERKHADRLRASHPRATQYTDIRILGVADEHPFMHPDLVAELKVVVPRALGFDPG
ncbi:MAG: phosphotyrosine protein phosphatase [Bradymonadia bacterium]